jgi:hypothetical protein
MAKIIGLLGFENRLCRIVSWLPENPCFKVEIYTPRGESEGYVYVEPEQLEFTQDEIKRMQDNEKIGKEIFKKYQLNFNLRLVARQ